MPARLGSMAAQRSGGLIMPIPLRRCGLRVPTSPARWPAKRIRPGSGSPREADGPPATRSPVTPHRARARMRALPEEQPERSFVTRVGGVGADHPAQHHHQFGFALVLVGIEILLPHL